MKFFVRLSILLFCISASAADYPSHWWAEVPIEELKSWELSPHTAPEGSVILSKRNELGLLSNFAATPFVLDKKTYASLEGFWQALKYPEDKADPRNHKKLKWPYTRSEVEQLTGHTAYQAGKVANKNMKLLGINWISYQNERLIYKGKDASKHYDIIYRASLAKVRQNPRVQEVLLSTRGLTLLPDHKQSSTATPAYRYFEIYMKIRDAEL